MTLTQYSRQSLNPNSVYETKNAKIPAPKSGSFLRITILHHRSRYMVWNWLISIRGTKLQSTRISWNQAQQRSASSPNSCGPKNLYKKWRTFINHLLFVKAIPFNHIYPCRMISIRHKTLCKPFQTRRRTMV